jgi:hypothetical protein
MSVSDWVPIASVVATATVGLGVPIVTSKFDPQKIRDQADEGRRDELRGVIDDAGAAITAAIFALDGAEEEAIELREWDEVSHPRKRPARDEYVKRLDSLWTYENRLAVRLRPEDASYQHYAEAVTELQKAVFAVSVGHGKEFDDDRQGLLHRCRRDAIRAQTLFHQAAAKRVGVAAPDERKRRLMGRASAS